MSDDDIQAELQQLRDEVSDLRVCLESLAGVARRYGQEHFNEARPHACTCVGIDLAFEVYWLDPLPPDAP